MQDRPDAPPGALPDDGLEVGYLVVLAGRAVEAATARGAAARGLQRAELNLLYEVAVHQPVSTRALAAVLDVRPSAVSPLTTRLEGAGLLRRDADAADARRRLWRLSTEGGALLAEAAQEVRPAVEAVFAGLDEQERARLAALLGQVAEPWLRARLDPQPRPHLDAAGSPRAGATSMGQAGARRHRNGGDCSIPEPTSRSDRDLRPSARAQPPAP